MRMSIDEKLIDEKVERFDDACTHRWTMLVVKLLLRLKIDE